ncbi:MAG: hypothetical protein JW990_01750 [Thermoleophilia bacterium]|nr:hypothetical protein [Thermoleophilia bacterium]
MNAYDIMHEWDSAAGLEPRTDEDLDREVPPRLSGDYETWKAQLEARHVPAIREGMKIWGLPAEPLRPFEVDDAIETAERPYSPE